jgi:hypothetical protein
MISIAHNGQELGQFSAEGVAGLLESGQIDRTAHYWVDGMPEWRPITEIIQTDPLPPPPPTLPPLKRRDAEEPNKRHVNYLSKRGFPTAGMTKTEIQDLFEKTKAEEERRANEITDRQRAFLDYHGINYTSKTTKTEASELISNADFPDSQWNSFKHLIHPTLYEKPKILGTSSDEIVAAQQALKKAKQRLLDLRSDPEATQDDLDEAESDVDSAKDDLQDAKDFSETASGDETLLESWPDDLWPFYGEEDILPAAEILKKPTKSQLQKIRQMLGEELGLHLESLSLWQFCCVYANLFPSALKKGKRNPFGEMPIPPTYNSQRGKQSAKPPQTRGSGGCLKLILLVVLAFVLFALTVPLLKFMAQ